MIVGEPPISQKSFTKSPKITTALVGARNRKKPIKERIRAKQYEQLNSFNNGKQTF